MTNTKRLFCSYIALTDILADIHKGFGENRVALHSTDQTKFILGSLPGHRKPRYPVHDVLKGEVFPKFSKCICVFPIRFCQAPISMGVPFNY